MSHQTHCIDFSWLMVGGFCVSFLGWGFFFVCVFSFLSKHATVLRQNALAMTFSLYF